MYRPEVSLVRLVIVRLKEYGGGLEQGLLNVNLASPLVMSVPFNCHCIITGQGFESTTALRVRSAVKSVWTRRVPSSLSEVAIGLVETSDSNTGGPA